MESSDRAIALQWLGNILLTSENQAEMKREEVELSKAGSFFSFHDAKEKRKVHLM
ncbi:hypothetical protein [Brevibacillus choshinensis]|uniref:hypothetical protein n=1 Tax=Brevibacillus choshinensis TaxID=54911 RepID=UPI002E1A957E|nr:hypothetical protein [Brevibacillus choshinensis]